MLYVNGAVKQTFTVTGARAYTMQIFKTSDAWMNCGPLSLRVVVDPDNQVAEADEQNNTNSNNPHSACPDVTASISKMTNPTLGCLKDVTIVGPLAPGEKFAYEPGGKYDLGQNLSVQVDITCGTTPTPTGACVESDYSNNTVRKGL